MSKPTGDLLADQQARGADARRAHNARMAAIHAAAAADFGRVGHSAMTDPYRYSDPEYDRYLEECRRDRLADYTPADGR